MLSVKHSPVRGMVKVVKLLRKPIMLEIKSDIGDCYACDEKPRNDTLPIKKWAPEGTHLNNYQLKISD